jgi:Na+-translocating ferredoxin:NAD+ oxidoreductase RnfD subunit
MGIIIPWALFLIGFFFNLILIYNAVTLPFLSGGGAAQADLGLFMLLMAFGIPIVILSAAVLVIHILRFNKNSILNALNKQNGVAYATIINIAIPPCIGFWLFFIWK